MHSRKPSRMHGMRHALLHQCFKYSLPSMLHYYFDKRKSKNTANSILVRELIITFYGEGDRLFVIAGHQFFLFPPWNAQKNSGPPPCMRKQILVPPLAYAKKFWSPPLVKEQPLPHLGKKFWSPLSDPQKKLEWKRGRCNQRNKWKDSGLYKEWNITCKNRKNMLQVISVRRGRSTIGHKCPGQDVPSESGRPGRNGLIRSVGCVC